MNKCKSCGRIIKDKKLDNYCSNCSRADGSLKSFDEVWENLAKFLRETQGLDEGASITAAKAIVSGSPAWEENHGVYFEEDMRKNRRTVVSLIVAISLILISVGVGAWVHFFGDINYDLFSSGDNFEKTRTVDSIEIHELDLGGDQSNPILSDGIFTFTSDRKRNAFDQFQIFSSDYWKDYPTRELYYYDINKQNGQKLLYIPNHTKTTGSDHVVTDDTLAMIYENNKNYIDRKIVYINNLENSIDFRRDHQIKLNKNEPFLMYPDILGDKQFQIDTIKSENYPIFLDINGDFMTWVEWNLERNYLSLFLKNLHTNKEVLVSSNCFGNPVLTENKLIWEDVSDITKPFSVIKIWDLETNQRTETEIDTKNYNIVSSNNDFLLLSSIEEANKYSIFGLNDFKLRVLDTMPDENSQPILSETSDEIAYVDDDGKIMITTNGDNKRTIQNTDSFENIKILKLTNNYVFFVGNFKDSNSQKLFISDIAAESTKTIIIDETEAKYPQMFFDIRISEGVISWVRMFDGDNNICWVKLSEIFPE